MTWPSLLVQNRLLIINNCCFGFSFPAVTEQSFQCWYLTCGILTWFVRYPPPHLPYEMPERFLIREYGADSYPVVFIDWVACVMLVVPVNNLSQEFHPGAGVIQRLLEMTLVIVDWKKNSRLGILETSRGFGNKFCISSISLSSTHSSKHQKCIDESIDK